MLKSIIEELLISDNKFDIVVFPVSIDNIEPIKILINKLW
jgi:ubiquinone/menaquinone biosynthesis C-methylase UbiE